MVQSYGSYGGLEKIGAGLKQVWEAVGEDVLGWAGDRIDQRAATIPAAQPMSTTPAPSGSGGYFQPARRPQGTVTPPAPAAPAPAAAGLPSWVIPAGVALVLVAVVMAAGRR